MFASPARGSLEALVTVCKGMAGPSVTLAALPLSSLLIPVLLESTVTTVHKARSLACVSDKLDPHSV